MNCCELFIVNRLVSGTRELKENNFITLQLVYLIEIYFFTMNKNYIIGCKELLNKNKYNIIYVILLYFCCTLVAIQSILLNNFFVYRQSRTKRIIIDILSLLS